MYFLSLLEEEVPSSNFFSFSPPAAVVVAGFFFLPDSSLHVCLDSNHYLSPFPDFFPFSFNLPSSVKITDTQLQVEEVKKENQGKVKKKETSSGVEVNNNLPLHSFLYLKMVLRRKEREKTVVERIRNNIPYTDIHLITSKKEKKQHETRET